MLTKTFTPFFWKTYQTVRRRPLRQPLRQPVVRVVPAPLEEAAAVLRLRVHQHQDALKNFFIVELRSHQEALLQLWVQAVVYIPQLKHFYLRRSRQVQGTEGVVVIAVVGTRFVSTAEVVQFFYSGCEK